MKKLVAICATFALLVIFAGGCAKKKEAQQPATPPATTPAPAETPATQ
jgi:hypothetical protein